MNFCSCTFLKPNSGDYTLHLRGRGKRNKNTPDMDSLSYTVSLKNVLETKNNSGVLQGNAQTKQMQLGRVISFHTKGPTNQTKLASTQGQKSTWFSFSAGGHCVFSPSARVPPHSLLKLANLKRICTNGMKDGAGGHRFWGCTVGKLVTIYLGQKRGGGGENICIKGFQCGRD